MQMCFFVTGDTEICHSKPRILPVWPGCSRGGVLEQNMKAYLTDYAVGRILHHHIPLLEVHHVLKQPDGCGRTAHDSPCCRTFSHDDTLPNVASSSLVDRACDNQNARALGSLICCGRWDVE